MKRLVEDADALSESFSAQRDEAGDVTLAYSDIIQAIHIVQQQMKITGTTAKEASDTVQGGAKAMSASWKNFVTGLADDNADIAKLANDVINSAVGMVKNIMPVVANVIQSIPNALSTLLSSLKDSGLINSVLETVKGMVSALIRELPSIIETLFDALYTVVENIDIGRLITTVFNMLNNIIKSIVPKIPELLMQLVAGIIEALPELFVGVGETIYNIFNGLFGGYDKFDAFSDKIKSQADAWQEVVDGMSEAKDEINNDYATWQEHWGLLQSIVDESGKVKDGYGNMAVMLAGELNEALGLNIEFQKGQIQNYDEICRSIDRVMDKKRAEMILEAEEEAYGEALKMRPELVNAVADAEANYEEALRQVEEAQQAYNNAETGGVDAMDSYQSALDTARINLSEMTESLDVARENLASNTALMTGYMDDYALAMNGDYQQIGRDTREYTGSTLEDLIAYRDSKQRTLEEDNANLEAWKKVASETNSEYAQEQVEYYERLKNTTEQQLEKINELVKKGGEDFSTGYVNGILGGEQKVSNASKDVANTALKSLQNTQQSQSPSKLTKNLGTYFTEGYVNGIKSMNGSVNSTATSVANQAISGLKSANSQSYNVGSNMVGGLISGVRNMAGSLYDTMTNMAYSAWNSVKSALGIHSPSTMFAELGERSAEGFGIGYANEMKAVTAEMANPTFGFETGVNNSMADSFGGFLSEIKNALGEHLTAMTELGEKHIDLYLDTGALVGGTASAMDKALGSIAVKTARGM